LNAGERARFDRYSPDRRIRHQQNLSVGRIALVLLTGSTKGRLVQQHVDRIALPLDPRRPGSYVEVETPFQARSLIWFDSRLRLAMRPVASRYEHEEDW
jgi:hypothetical protein